MHAHREGGKVTSIKEPDYAVLYNLIKAHVISDIFEATLLYVTGNLAFLRED